METGNSKLETRNSAPRFGVWLAVFDFRISIFGIAQDSDS